MILTNKFLILKNYSFLSLGRDGILKSSFTARLITELILALFLDHTRSLVIFYKNKNKFRIRNINSSKKILNKENKIGRILLVGIFVYFMLYSLYLFLLLMVFTWPYFSKLNFSSSTRLTKNNKLVVFVK